MHSLGFVLALDSIPCDLPSSVPFSFGPFALLHCLLLFSQLVEAEGCRLVVLEIGCGVRVPVVHFLMN